MGVDMDNITISPIGPGQASYNQDIDDLAVQGMDNNHLQWSGIELMTS